MTASNRLVGEKAKEALRKRFGKQSNSQGYVSWLQDNLIPGVRLDQFEEDLLRGDGNELRVKFCAVHSSSTVCYP